VTAPTAITDAQARLFERNRVFKEFFDREAGPLAEACREMSDRFLRGGRLLAFGRGPYATDAQHVSVEFVHPIVVGKRALPAMDLSLLARPWLEALLRPEDIVMGFGRPEGDTEVHEILALANQRGAMTFALPGVGSYSLPSPLKHPFFHQELIEILYHTLWETVHVFFEHRGLAADAGDSAFLYPFLGGEKQPMEDIVEDVSRSIRMKVADDGKLRDQLARDELEKIVEVAAVIYERISRGGKLIIFGNGGSATDANDFTIDCVSPPGGWRPIPAISLSMEPANLSAIANDVGIDLIFLRQLVAHARGEDVAIGISTSGNSRNVIAALEEAKKRGLLTIALLGYDGGEILRRKLADLSLVVRSDYIPRIQEAQASIYHLIRELIEDRFRGV
jgi:D-sedoheptulose 7-phosphate isomerase